MSTRRFAVVLLGLCGFLLGAAPQREITVFNMALTGDPNTLDPQATSGTLTFQAVRSIYDTLVEPDPTGKIIPALATSWDVSDDSLVWTFHLREGVRFHNGDRLSSHDVKASLDRTMDEEFGSPNRSQYSSIAAVETPDDLTVVIRLSEYMPVLATLASGWSAILPRGLIEAGHDFASQPVGTGPFRLTEWIRDAKIVLDKNEEYWMSGAPWLDAVILHIIPERIVQVQGLRTGALDAAYNLLPDDLSPLQGNPDIRVERSLTSLVFVMAMNCEREDLDDLRVRQAVNHAINKQKVMDVAYGGGRVVSTFMDYGNAYYNDVGDLYPYDPAQARKLIQSAGIGADREFIMALPQNYELHVKAGEIYHEMLTRVGLNVKIRLVDWSTWISDVYRGGNYDFTVIAHTGKLDPDGRLGGYGTRQTYVRWVNEEAAALITEARGVAGFAERKRLYDRALEIMAIEVPHVYTGTSYRHVGLRSNVSGFRMDPILDTFDFRFTRKQ